MPSIDTTAIRAYLLALQKQLCSALSHEDGSASFREDRWQRSQDNQLKGDGITCVLEEGRVFEKAGVNFSHVYGHALPTSARTTRDMANKPFEALGLSLVIHPYNPYVPTSHANVRFFSTTNANEEPVWWFGGGFDLTPYYGFEEDAIHWHTVAQQACEPYGEEVYPILKHWCDDYFYLKHRQEPRGIGGLFFDDWNRWDFNTCFNFMKSIGNAYLPAYLPIVQKRKHTLFGEREKTFQKIRRGRYVEFNLIYDRGTLFGLQSGGRTESILMSLPKEASWVYDEQPDSKDHQEIKTFLIPRNWV